QLEAARDDALADLVDALLLAGEQLVDEEHVAGVEGVVDELQLVQDVLDRARAEAAARQLLLAEDAAEGAAAAGEDVEQLLLVHRRVALEGQQVPRREGDAVQVLDQRRLRVAAAAAVVVEGDARHAGQRVLARVD